MHVLCTFAVITAVNIAIMVFVWRFAYDLTYPFHRKYDRRALVNYGRYKWVYRLMLPAMQRLYTGRKAAMNVGRKKSYFVLHGPL